MLFKFGVTFVIAVGIILFYLVNIQNTEQHGNYKGMVGDAVQHALMDESNHMRKELDQEAQPEDRKNLRKESNGNSDNKQGVELKVETILPQEKLHGHTVHLCVVVCGSRADETMVMLKSAAIVTPLSISLVFHIIAEPANQIQFRDQLELWPYAHRQRLSYKIYNVSFPGGATSDSWKKLFKPCASQRLFLPDLLKDVDSLIYVDTDTLFLQSLSDLWQHFKRMNRSQLVGVVSEAEDGTAGWYNRFANHPYYGEFGVNSGVMLMNLTRLRKTSWLSDMQIFYNKYYMMIPWGDQDLINIFFAAHPDQLYLMGCQWNYRSDHCKYMSNCRAAEERGVSVLHGSRRIFYKEREPSFAAVFETFKNYKLGDDPEQQFLKILEDNLSKAESSNCGKVSHIFLMQLWKLVNRTMELKNEKEKLSDQDVDSMRSADENAHMSFDDVIEAIDRHRLKAAGDPDKRHGNVSFPSASNVQHQPDTKLLGKNYQGVGDTHIQSLDKGRSEDNGSVIKAVTEDYVSDIKRSDENVPRAQSNNAIVSVQEDDQYDYYGDEK
ncbi:unnamed protein product [Lymnaea stagnalis]|uniref:UDP-D-xylose:beta-D-glucoside alpha-1,3-D-xylosyltransferase n=1 Tax=Lymnaea stagnalis TaxID=6523 RepID=A0AAV2HSS4_LYMST